MNISLPTTLTKRSCLFLLNFGNGRFARNLIEGALFGQAPRLTRQNFSTMTMDDIVTLKARDFDLTEDDTLEEEPKHIGFNR